MFPKLAVLTCVGLVPLVVSTSHSSCLDTSAPSATIDEGIVIGTTTSLPAATASVNKFLGVPFAQSPPERFAPPKRPARSKQPINATQWSPACIQQFSYPQQSREFTISTFNNPPPEESEDCLYLNVYAPSTPPPSGGRAVLYWMFGGGLAFGNAGQEAYDGSWFASYEDVVVVTVNYRTNAFGFPSAPELPLNERNLGFLDQRLGLDWVQRNIAQFGGSPEKVTIFGESAGARSADALITSFGPDDDVPFRAAILQSGQGTFGNSPSANAAPSWLQLSESLGCPGSYDSNVACLRAADALDIKETIERQALSFGPVPDNETLVSDPAARLEAGQTSRVPILAGTTSQEGRVFNVGQNNTEAFLAGLTGNNTALAAAIQAAYPLGSTADLVTPYDQISQIYTEYVFQCPQARQINGTIAAGIPAWRFYFNATFANTQAFPGGGAYHASEIPIVFSTYPRPGTTTQQYALSQTMRRAWADFAKNPAYGPGWNQAGTGQAGQVLVGAYTPELGGVYLNDEGEVLEGRFNLGVFGDAGGSYRSAGVTVIDESEVDARCALFEPIIQAAFAAAGR